MGQHVLTYSSSSQSQSWTQDERVVVIQAHHQLVGLRGEYTF